jgi:hypothetical protein
MSGAVSSPKFRAHSSNPRRFGWRGCCCQKRRRYQPGHDSGCARAHGDGDHLLYGHRERGAFEPGSYLGLHTAGYLPWRREPGYVVAQMTGGIAAALFLRALFGTVGALGTATWARNIGANGAIAVGG